MPAKPKSVTKSVPKPKAPKPKAAKARPTSDGPTPKVPAKRAKKADAPARRQRLQPEQRRELLLDAAARTFTRLGYESARMDDVAKEAGVAKGLLYQHFPSKDALFEALMRARGEQFDERLRERWASVTGDRRPDPTTLVEAGVAFWLDEATSDDAMVNGWIDPEQWDRAAPMRDRSIQSIVEQISLADPKLDPDLAWLVAAAYQGAVEAATMQWHRRGRAVSRDALEQIIVSFCLKGLDGMAKLSGERHRGPGIVSKE